PADATARDGPENNSNGNAGIDFLPRTPARRERHLPEAEHASGLPVRFPPVRMKNRLIRLLLVAVLGLAAAAKKSEPETELVELPKYKVVADWFTIHYVWTDSQGLISAKIEEVTPNSPADKAGLRPGDHLDAINGVTLAGLPFTKFNELFDLEIRPEH